MAFGVKGLYYPPLSPAHGLDEFLMTAAYYIQLLNNEKNPMQSENTSKYGNQKMNIPQPTHRCGAKTRRGTPCKSYPVRGKKRCRMHGGKNPGRPRNPKVQARKYRQMVRMHIKKICIGCPFVDKNCLKIYCGKDLPEDFACRLSKYCRACA